MNKHEEIIITKYDLLYEQRMTRVETTLENIASNFSDIKTEMKSDFRWMLGIMIGGYGSLLALMAHGFHWF